MDEKFSSRPLQYNAYLLRFWNEISEGHPMKLRLILIDLRTGKQWSFATLVRLFDFLGQTASADDTQTEKA